MAVEDDGVVLGVGVAELDGTGCGGVTMEAESENVSDAALGRSASAPITAAPAARVRERVIIAFAPPTEDGEAVAEMAEGVCSSGASEAAGGAKVACAAASATEALLPLGVLTATEREPESRSRIGCFFELETGDAVDVDAAATGGELERSAATGCSRSNFCTKE